MSLAATNILDFAPAQRTISLFSLISLRKSRQDLARMDEYMLRDIGLSVDEAQAESQRSFWDVPAGWGR